MENLMWKRRDYDDDFLVYYGQNKINKCKTCRKLKLEIQKLKERIKELENERTKSD
ncbi:MAG: hypothetical protein ACFFD1_04570 [Candidatus Thorarchaeota archaeon]